MNNMLPKTSPKDIFFVAIAILMFITACSKQIYSEPSIQNIQNIENPVENKKISMFIEAGTQKTLKIKNSTASDIIKTAKTYLGVPHCMGGTTKKCIDCSGLLVAVFAQHGIQLPHNSEDQSRYGKIIADMDNLREGDLVFFTRSYKTNQFITHSGICTGNNKFIHTSSKAGVTITSLNDPYWNEKFVFGTRVIEQ